MAPARCLQQDKLNSFTMAPARWVQQDKLNSFTMAQPHNDWTTTYTDGLTFLYSLTTCMTHQACVHIHRQHG